MSDRISGTGPGGDLLLELVLCTRNGGARLERCLRAIRDSDHSHPFLVHIVDNGSDDGRSPAIARHFIAAFGDRARYSEERRPGNSAGRNAALRHLRGTHAIFTDDDCYLAPDCMAAWAAVLRGADHGYAGGTILPFDPANSPLGCWSAPEAIEVRPRGFVRRGFIQGSNMMFSAACLRDIGLFDPRFGAGVAYAGEDWDMAIAASRAGWRGAYFPAPTVHHDHGRGVEEAAERLHFYDYGAGAVYAKHALRRLDVRAARGLLRELRRLPAERRRALLAGFRDYLARRDVR